MTDAHNHLQQLLDPSAALARCELAGVRRMVVNGTCEEDWPEVSALAAASPVVIPAYGVHPWQVPERSLSWLQTLRERLEENPRAMVGECGLDRWKKPFDLPDQLQCLREQISLAIELKRPITIHCLQAWGPLLELLQSLPSPPRFLLHAYSGSREMVTPLARLGAYFSFNGYFLHERKAAVRETFLAIPTERLLLETDAPAMLPPSHYLAKELPESQNDVANLPLFLPPLASLLQISQPDLSSQLESNFQAFSQTVF